jgi:hypothetical protein
MAPAVPVNPFDLEGYGALSCVVQARQTDTWQQINTQARSLTEPIHPLSLSTNNIRKSQAPLFLVLKSSPERRAPVFLFLSFFYL